VTVLSNDHVVGRVLPSFRRAAASVFFPMPRGEVAGTFENSWLRTSPRVISTAVSITLPSWKEGRNPPYPSLYVQSPVMQGVADRPGWFSFRFVQFKISSFEFLLQDSSDFRFRNLIPQMY
jgi:hypothetical protein